MAGVLLMHFPGGSLVDAVQRLELANEKLEQHNAEMDAAAARFEELFLQCVERVGRLEELLALHLAMAQKHHDAQPLFDLVKVRVAELDAHGDFTVENPEDWGA